MRHLLGLSIFVGVVVVTGCRKGDGLKSYRLTGLVTLDGKPIPAGEIIFTPDMGKKNDGVQGIAVIRDGKYDTGASGGKGIAGGPTIIRVNGMSDVPGKGQTLCEYEMQMDLPRADGKQDLAVPKSGASNPKKAPDI